MLFTADAIGRLSVARHTGDVLFLATPESEVASADAHVREEVWRLSPEGKVERTEAALDEVPFLAVVSPDGDRLAVVPRAKGERARPVPYGQGLIIYSVSDGASHVIRALEGKLIFSVDWVLAGRALLVGEPAGVWLVNVHGELTDTAPFSLQEPASAHPVVEAEDDSRSNLQQLGMALLIYLADHDDTFPDLSDMGAARDALRGYVKSDEVFVHPRTKEPYGVNSTLSGKRFADVEDPVEMVVFYETAAGEDGSRDVAFGDGHVAHVSADRWEEIKEALPIH